MLFFYSNVKLLLEHKIRFWSSSTLQSHQHNICTPSEWNFWASKIDIFSILVVPTFHSKEAIFLKGNIPLCLKRNKNCIQRILKNHQFELGIEPNKCVKKIFLYYIPTDRKRSVTWTKFFWVTMKFNILIKIRLNPFRWWKLCIPVIDLCISMQTLGQGIDL